MVKGWQHPNARIFREELEDQPDNVIETLYNDCLREAVYQAELRKLRLLNKLQNKA